MCVNPFFEIKIPLELSYFTHIKLYRAQTPFHSSIYLFIYLFSTLFLSVYIRTKKQYIIYKMTHIHYVKGPSTHNFHLLLSLFYSVLAGVGFFWLLDVCSCFRLNAVHSNSHPKNRSFDKQLKLTKLQLFKYWLKRNISKIRTNNCISCSKSLLFV